MDNFTVKNGEKLKYGYTTGSCATAASIAAGEMALTGNKIVSATIQLPQGEAVTFAINNVSIDKDGVSCSVTKDGGDDPDITHGAEIYSSVKLIPEGIEIKGGNGVGTVTTEGMRCAKGEAAINPMPRKMIQENLIALGRRFHYKGGFSVEISVPQGEALAEKTYNPRLGIIGGISILGTTGIVEPMSEKALVDTIKVLVDKQYVLDEEKILIAPGNYGQEFALNNLDLDINKAVKISNYMGETLDYIKYKGFKKALLIGHTGKLIKLAGGIMNTHSSYGDCRMEIISSYVGLLGGSPKLIEGILKCVTTDEAFGLVKKEGLMNPLKEKIIERVKYHLDFRLKKQVGIEFVMFTTDKSLVMASRGAEAMIKLFKEEEI